MSALVEPAVKCCRCKHMESSHDEGGCMWCRCKCFKHCRSTSINTANALACYRAQGSVPAGLFAEEKAS
jgi:hypothetical protein